MNRGGLILDAMARLINLFAQTCSDRTTLDELANLLSYQERWPEAHDFSADQAENFEHAGF